MFTLHRPTKLRHYLAAMQRQGWTASQVLQGSGIARNRLEDPSFLVDAQQYETVIKNMLRLTGNPALGFEMGSSAKLTDFGILAHAMMSSPTFRQALLLWVRYANLVGMTIQLKFGHENTRHWTMLINAGAATSRASAEVQQFFVEEILMTAIHLGTALAEDRFVPEKCYLSYPAPDHAASYTRYLKCPVEFGADQSCLVVTSPELDLPLSGHDAEFNAICLRHCQQIMRQLGSASTVVAKLRGLLVTRSVGIPNLPEAAQFLGLSERTLRRQLQQAGTTYQQVLDELRVDLAREYVQSEGLVPKEIAHLLGFKSVVSFRRAFKTWTGMTVSQFLKWQNP